MKSFNSFVLPFVLLFVISGTVLSNDGSIIPGQYIIVLKDKMTVSGNDGLLGIRKLNTVMDELVKKHGGEVLYAYKDALMGFAYKFDSPKISSSSIESILKTIEDDPDVEYIEKDKIVALEPIKLSSYQDNARWALDRLNQRKLPLDGNVDSQIDNTASVDVYIIDTGVRISHDEIIGRSIYGYNVLNPNADPTDCNGHGTHVAGIVGGNTCGIAKNVRLISVRVLDCEGKGTISSVIAGVDWVTYSNSRTGTTPALANMSLGGGKSQALDDAVKKSISAGITYVIAAGNEDKDACLFSPSGVSDKGAIVVGSININDQKSNFSNYGRCLDVFAPGESIMSSCHRNDSDYCSKRGTSMAAPFVTGVAALYLQFYQKGSDVNVKNAIMSNSTDNLISSPGNGSPNKLIYSRMKYGSGSSTTKRYWYLSNSINLGKADNVFFFGGPSTSAETAIVGDWNGDGVDTVGVFNSEKGTWYMRNSNDSGPVDVSHSWIHGNISPLPGKWDGKRDQLGVYDKSNATFHLFYDTAIVKITHGNLGDIPLSGDWDGDGKDTIGVYRPSERIFYLRLTNEPNNTKNFAVIRYGNLGDIPLIGDWDGDGKDTIGVYRPYNGTFYLRQTNNPADQRSHGVLYGNAGDIPIVGRWASKAHTTIGTVRFRE